VHIIRLALFGFQIYSCMGSPRLYARKLLFPSNAS
jgi:hypothetical protein